MPAARLIAPATPVPIQQNLNWNLGSTWLLMLEIVADTGQLLPNEVDDVQVRFASNTGVILDLNFDSGVTCPDPDGPYALVRIDPDRQADFAVGAYRYEARCLTPAGGVFELQYGALTVGPSLFEQFPPPDPADTDAGVIGGPQLQIPNL